MCHRELAGSANTGWSAAEAVHGIAASPDGAAIVLLSSCAAGQGTMMEASLTIFSTSDLSRLGSPTTWQSPKPSRVTNMLAPVQSMTLHVSPDSVAVCTAGFGSRVFAYDAASCRLGSKLFFSRGLQQVSVSHDGAFLAGIKDKAHIVVDGRTGSTCFELPALTLDKAQPPAKACSIAWHGSALHAGYKGGEPDSEFDAGTVLAWSVMDFA